MKTIKKCIALHRIITFNASYQMQDSYVYGALLPTVTTGTFQHTHKLESKNFEYVAIQAGQVLCLLISIIQYNLRPANTVSYKNITLYYSKKPVNLTFYTVMMVSTQLIGSKINKYNNTFKN